MEHSETQAKILEIGKKEFLSKGFKNASLRGIVKEAGFTQGAFYGYYDSKEDLFNALVEEPAEYFMTEYKHMQEEFKKLSAQEQKVAMGQASESWMEGILDYLLAHKDAFKLILCHSDGTKYADYIHQMVQIEVESTHDFVRSVETTGTPVRRISPQLEHILISGMFAAFFEIIIHDMPREEAITYARDLCRFQKAGWREIIGM